MYTLLDRILKTYLPSNLRYTAYWVTVIFSILLMFSLAARVVYSTPKKRKKNWGLILISGYLLLGTLYYLPYLDKKQFQPQLIVPELVCTIDDNTVVSGGPIKSYFMIEKWPVLLTSIAYDEVYNDVSLQNACSYDLNKFTYFICYGLEISEVKYSFSHANNRLLFPYNGLVAPVFFSYGKAVPGKIIIYRIPRVAVDTIS